jgi:hypothetical protein
VHGIGLQAADSLDGKFSVSCRGTEVHRHLSRLVGWHRCRAAESSTVNRCLFKYFTDIAKRLGCEAVWWDAVSVPTETSARAKAIRSMADQYAHAEYTVVHDAHLLNFPWSKERNGKRNDGAWLALVFSSGFTRGWTGVELALSKNVIVLQRKS